MKELVSVIVPVYKVEKYLNECIESIVCQTYKNLEIILVDDGSPDNCPKICEEWAKKDNRIKVIHKQNGGLMAAWMDGVKSSKGQYICFVDSDDYVENNFVERLYFALINNDADVCACNYSEIVDGNKEYLNYIKSEQLIETNKDVENLVLLFNLNNETSTPHCRWNKIYKREMILDSFEFLDTSINMGEDLNLSFYIFGTSKKCAVIQDYLYCYRKLNDSMSHISKNYWVSYEKLLHQLLKINESKNMNMEQFIYSMYYIRYVIASLRHCFKFNKKEDVNYIVNCEITKTAVTKMKPRKIKHKLFIWALKHKITWLLRLACK